MKSRATMRGASSVRRGRHGQPEGISSCCRSLIAPVFVSVSVSVFFFSLVPPSVRLFSPRLENHPPSIVRVAHCLPVAEGQAHVPADVPPFSVISSPSSFGIDSSSPPRLPLSRGSFAPCPPCSPTCPIPHRSLPLPPAFTLALRAVAHGPPSTGETRRATLPPSTITTRHVINARSSVRARPSSTARALRT